MSVCIRFFSCYNSHVFKGVLKMDLYKILANIRKADIDYKLIEDGDRIAVGVSGGKDSMVLLTALHMYSKFKGKNFEVVGIHIKLGFPNMNFDEVVNFCEQEGIEFHMFDSKVYDILKQHPDKNGNIKCSLCSKFKKATVIQESKAFHCNKVAFGHHSDDAVETLMMNAIYGGKLAVFLPKMYLSKTDITFIRPLIYAYESDILLAQQQNSIPYVKSGCPNDGFTQRQEMKDMLQSFYEKFPMARQNFLHMLSNEEQIELWHKEDSQGIQGYREAKMHILKEERNMKLGKRGNRYFILYAPLELPEQTRNQLISKQEADAILENKITIESMINKQSS